MRKYEIMFIVKPDLEEQSIKDVVESMKKVLTTNKATIVEEKILGQKELAYEINDYKTGYYFFYVVTAENKKAVSEFDRISRINENVIKSLIIKIED